MAEKKVPQLIHELTFLADRDDVAKLTYLLVKNDIKFNLKRGGELLIQMIPHYELAAEISFQEIVAERKRQLQVQLTNRLFDLQSVYTDSLYTIETKIAQHGPLDAPLKLLNERRQIQEDIQEIERRIKDLSAEVQSFGKLNQLPGLASR